MGLLFFVNKTKTAGVAMADQETESEAEPVSAEQLETILSKMRSLHEEAAAVLTAVKSDASLSSNAVGEIQERLDSVPDIVAEANGVLSEVNGIKDKMVVSRSELEVIKKAADQSTEQFRVLHAEVKEISTELQVKQEAIGSAKAEVDAAAQAIRATANQGEEAKAAIVAAKAEVERDRDTQKALLEELQSASKMFNEEKEKFSEYQKEQQLLVSETIEKANSMLDGATNVGLAASFGKEAEVLDEKAKDARTQFTFGIVGLVLSLAPLLFLVFAPGEPELTIASILARSILVAPAIWFCQFTARRHSALFELRQHYSHKHNMTFSMKTFRDLAGAGDKDIIKEVFDKVSENPADILKLHRKMAEGPFGSIFGFFGKRDRNIHLENDK